MPLPDPILIVQTAFLGDVILTLPLATALRGLVPGARIDLLVTPSAAGIVAGHPDIRETLVYDKRGADSGLAGFFRMKDIIGGRGYGCAIVPHRSLRSAALARMAGIPVRIGFDSSAGRMLYTRTVPYRRTLHEVDRNLRLLEGIGVAVPTTPPARLAAGEEGERRVREFLSSAGAGEPGRNIAIAPGSIWRTKRWPSGRYAALAAALAGRGHRIILVGGPGDVEICAEVGAAVNGNGERAGAINACGKFSILESAELIRSAALLICNDSAPLHLAGAVGTPVLAIFGPTIPGFGFGPRGPLDRVLENRGLWCRPCSIHGGDRCPVGGFACMEGVSVDEVFRAALAMTGTGGPA